MAVYEMSLTFNLAETALYKSLYKKLAGGLVQYGSRNHVQRSHKLVQNKTQRTDYKTKIRFQDQYSIEHCRRFKGFYLLLDQPKKINHGRKGMYF